MISIKHVNKNFSIGNKQIHALKDINLDISQGSIFGVIGSSGAGKSTLIRCVNLLEKPSSGDICVDKINLTQLSRTDLTLARRKIGMIFQHFNLLSSRNVFENIALPLELANSNYFNKCKEFPYLCASFSFDLLKKFKFIEKKIPQKNIAWIDKGLTNRNEFLARKNKKVRELLKLVGLDDKENEYPANLSGGQKQRVAIARALASDPKVLLCDEATSALDPATTQSILKLLKEINTRLGITILIITHEMDVVKGICNQVAIIGGGELVETGSVGDIFAHPKTTLAKEFIRSTLDLSVPDDYKVRLEKNWSEGKNTLVRLEFTGSSVDAPIISFMCRKYNLDISILSSDMDYAGGVKFGIMLAEIIGTQADGENAFSYLKEQKVQVEVLGYV